jgi:outer membrane lipase/esterase
MRKTFGLLITSAIGLTLATPVSAQSEQDNSEGDEPDPVAYSDTVFFGDSTIDSGFFRPLLPASVRPVTGQFTTNPAPVWSQYLADFFATQARPNGNGQTGTNYAAGGARVGTNTTGALGPIPSVRTQIGNYLTSKGGSADPDALYVISGGMNDLFAIVNAGADPTLTMQAATAGMTDSVSALTVGGARYIVVANVQDLGLTPALRATGPASAATVTVLSEELGSRYFTSLAAAGLRVIPIDMLTFSRELHNQAAAFGFTNVTGTACQPQITANSLTCNPTSVIAPDARNTHLYADGVHFSARAHDIIAQYVASVLEAPRLVAQLPYTAGVSGQSRAERVLAHTSLGGGEQKGFWLDLRGDWQRLSSNDRYEGDMVNVLAGFDLLAGNVALGIFAGYGKGSFDFGTRNPGGTSEIPVANAFTWESNRDWLYSQVRGGGYDQSELTLGVYAGLKFAGAWLHAQASYTALDYDVERVVNLAGRVSRLVPGTFSFEHVLTNETLGGVTRTHAGSPNGSVVALGVNAGWEFSMGPVNTGPVAGVLAQFISVDEYSETNANLATALGYPKQSWDSVLGNVGWQASFELSKTIEPYAKVVYQREFKQLPEEAFARSLTIPGALDFAVPGIGFDRDFVTATLGVLAQVAGISVNLGGMATFGRGDGTDATAFLGISGQF